MRINVNMQQKYVDKQHYHVNVRDNYVKMVLIISYVAFNEN